jgi:hypothetical protein
MPPGGEQFILIQVAFVGLLHHFKQCMLKLAGGEQFMFIETALLACLGERCAHRVRDDALVSQASCT